MTDIEVQKKDWLQDSFVQCRIVLASSWKLEGIADALRTTGNESLAWQLDSIAKDLHSARERLSDNILESVKERFKASQEASSNILRAALAGAELERTTKEK